MPPDPLRGPHDVDIDVNGDGPHVSEMPDRLSKRWESTASAASTTERSTVGLEQERMAVLRMVADGRITPEEGDMLLEAL